MDSIDGPYVINLDHRGDRWDQVQREFAKGGVGAPIRFPAIYTPGDGATGCLASHLGAISKGGAYRPIWICEDDICFLESGAVVTAYIDAFLQSDADVLCLGFADYKHVDYDDNFYRTVDCQTASCYIVKPRAMAELRDLWQGVLSCRQMKTTHPLEDDYKRLPIHNPDFYWNDQSWKLLQQKFTFVIPKRRCVYQRESYSDIEQCVVNYRC